MAESCQITSVFKSRGCFSVVISGKYGDVSDVNLIVLKMEEGGCTGQFYVNLTQATRVI